MYTNLRNMWLKYKLRIKISFTLLISICFALSFNATIAQEKNSTTDSLLQIVYANKQDSSTVQALFKLAQSNLHSNPNQCKIETEKAMTMAKSIKWKRGMAKCHNLLGIIFFEQYAYEKSIAQYDSALQLFNTKTEGNQIALLYNNIGNAYAELKNHPKALEYYLKSLNMNETIENQEGISMNCLNIGFFYSIKLKNYAAALQYSKKSLEVSTKIKDTLLMSEGLNNLAIIYQDNGKIDSALKLYQQAYVLNNLISNNRGLSISALNSGLIYAKRQEINSADSLFHISLNIAKKAGLKGVLITALQNLSSLNIEKAKSSSGEKAREYLFNAKQFAYEGIDSASSSGKPDTPYAYYKILSEIEELSGNPSKSLYFFKHGQKISDSIYSKENEDRINLLEQERKQFEEQREEDDQKLKAKVAKTIQLLSIFTGILILISIIIFLTSKKLNHRLIQFLGTLSVLAIFELIAILIHPFLEKITHHNLILMLLCLIVIAAIIIPIHHRTEHWVKEFIAKRINHTKSKK